MFSRHLPLLNKYGTLLLFVFLYIILAFPDRLGRSLYAYSETIRDLGMVESIGRGSIVLLGPVSSLGNFHFGPIYYYLLYPLVALTGFQLWSLSVASIFYNVLTIILTYLVVLKWWDRPVLANIAAGLTATSNLTFQLGRYASNPNFVPLFSLLFFYALERLMSHDAKKSFYIFIMAVAFSVSIQLHAVPLICLPIILLLLLIQRKFYLNFQQWVIFILSFLAVNSLYLYYELTHDFTNLKTLFTLGGSPSPYVNFYDRILFYLGFWLQPLFSNNTFFSLPLLFGLKFYIFLILIVVMGYLIFKYDQHQENPVIVFPGVNQNVRTVLLYWLVICTTIFILPVGNLTGIRFYYYLIISPLVFIFLALWLYKLYLKNYRNFLCYFLVIYLLLQIGQVVLYHHLVSNLK